MWIELFEIDLSRSLWLQGGIKYHSFSKRWSKVIFTYYWLKFQDRQRSVTTHFCHEMQYVLHTLSVRLKN